MIKSESFCVCRFRSTAPAVVCTRTERLSDRRQLRKFRFGSRRQVRRYQKIDRCGQGKGLPHLQRGQRPDPARPAFARRPRRPADHHRHAGHRCARRAEDARFRQEVRYRAGSWRRRRTRPHAGRAGKDQRSGAHVPARDGHGAAAHPRRRSGNRQAHRARPVARTEGAVALADRDPRDRRHRRGPEARRALHQGSGALRRRRDHRRGGAQPPEGHHRQD